MGEVSGDGLERLFAGDYVSFLGAFAEHPDLPLAVGEMIYVQADYLADAEAGGVDELQECPVSQALGGGVLGGLDERGGLLGREELGEFLVKLGKGYAGHGVGFEDALPDEEAVESAEHTDLAGDAAHIVAVLGEALGDLDPAFGHEP